MADIRILVYPWNETCDSRWHVREPIQSAISFLSCKHRNINLYQNTSICFSKRKWIWQNNPNATNFWYMVYIKGMKSVTDNMFLLLVEVCMDYSIYSTQVLKMLSEHTKLYNFIIRKQQTTSKWTFVGLLPALNLIEVYIDIMNARNERNAFDVIDFSLIHGLHTNGPLCGHEITFSFPRNVLNNVNYFYQRRYYKGIQLNAYHINIASSSSVFNDFCRNE